MFSIKYENKLKPLNVTDDNLLELHDSYNLEFFFNCLCISYFLICPFCVFEMNTGRMRPPSPSCSTSMIPYWRVCVEVSILQNNHVVIC